MRRTLLSCVVAALACALVPQEAGALCQSKPVEMVMTTWCPYCKQARAFFHTQGVQFTEVDAERTNDPVVRTIFKTMGVPYIFTERGEIRGFNEPALRKALCIE